MTVGHLRIIQTNPAVSVALTTETLSSKGLRGLFTWKNGTPILLSKLFLSFASNKRHVHSIFKNIFNTSNIYYNIFSREEGERM